MRSFKNSDFVNNSTLIGSIFLNYVFMYPIFNPRKYLSHLLICISVVVSIIGFLNPIFISLYGFHSNAFFTSLSSFFLQSVLFQFLHGDILHLGMNAYFLYIAWPEVESRMSKNAFLMFFLTTTIAIIIALILFWDPHSLTIGISGFCTALLAYTTADLYKIKHPQFMNFAVMLAINILIGFSGGISFIGHFFWALWWWVWWLYHTKAFRRK